MLAAATLPVAAGTTCATPVGHVVLLRSGDLDPDVFVWDSRQRIVAYAAGDWHGTQEVLAHTVLAKPGTRALIVKCMPAEIERKFVSEREDAVAVRLLSGPSRGRYGWVTSEDIHPASR